jgi:hypothetical protein
MFEGPLYGDWRSQATAASPALEAAILGPICGWAMDVEEIDHGFHGWHGYSSGRHLFVFGTYGNVSRKGAKAQRKNKQFRFNHDGTTGTT